MERPGDGRETCHLHELNNGLYNYLSSETISSTQNKSYTCNLYPGDYCKKKIRNSPNFMFTILFMNSLLYGPLEISL